jgi:hypothetical protein
MNKTEVIGVRCELIYTTCGFLNSGLRSLKMAMLSRVRDLQIDIVLMIPYRKLEDWYTLGKTAIQRTMGLLFPVEHTRLSKGVRNTDLRFHPV